jgi:hypothetical protein
MQRPRPTGSDEARIYDSWIEDPGPFIDLTMDDHRPLTADADGFVPGSGNGDPRIASLSADSTSNRRLL